MPKSKPAKSVAKTKTRPAAKAAKKAVKPAASAKAAKKARPAAKTPAAPKKPSKPVKAATKPAAKSTAKPAAKPAKNQAKPAKVAKPLAKKLPATNGKSPAPAPVAKSTPTAPAPVVRRIIPDSKLTPFLRKQKERLYQLRDSMLDSMLGVAKDTLRSRAEGSEASAFGMHQADAGSDAYDRDFALSLLSKEQDALYEIEEAIKRIESGTYGICEISGKSIAHARLEAMPFARCTVECQSQLEKQNKHFNIRKPVTSLFGLTDEEPGETEEEETVSETKE